MKKRQREKRIAALLALGVLLTLSACQAPPPDGIGSVDGGLADVDGASRDAPRAFGVIASDRTVSSVTLLNPDGSLLERDFVHSASASTGLVAALSGDVVLPTRSGDPGILTLIDRYRSDVITRIDPETGEVLGQVMTHTPPTDDRAAAYSSNPHDYVWVDEDNAWVTRFEPNQERGEEHADGGNDLLHIDPSSFERGRRISLWHLNGEGERENANTGASETVTTYARPSRIVRLGEHLVVGLAGLSGSYDAVGPGRVALVDLADEHASGFDLPDLANCTQVVPIPGEDDRVAVACEGFFRGRQRDAAGLSVLTLSDGALSIDHVLRAADDPDAPLAISFMVALGGDLVLAVAAGAQAVRDQDGHIVSPETHDVAYLVDVATGEHEPLFEAEGRYKIGQGAYSPDTGVLLLPDASVDDDARPIAGVRRFERGEDGHFEPVDIVKTHELLPPLQVRGL